MLRPHACRRSLLERIDRSGRAAGATGEGSEAHRGADGRRRSHGADPRSSCAAAGGQVGGRAEDRRPLCAGAGDRSAQDLSRVLRAPQTAAGTWQVRSWRQLVPDRFW